MEALPVIRKGGIGPRAATSDERERLKNAIAQECMIRSRVQTLPDSMYQELTRHIEEASIAVFKTATPTYVILWNDGNETVAVFHQDMHGEIVLVADTAR